MQPEVAFSVSAPSGGHGRCPLVPTFLGSLGRQGCSPHPWEPLAAGPRPPRCTYMQPEVAFSVKRALRGHGRCPLVPTFREPPGRQGCSPHPWEPPCRRAEAPGGRTYMQPEVAFSVKRALRGPRALPFDSHLPGSLPAGGGARHPWEPLAAGAEAPGGRTYMQPEVAFSVSAPSGGHGRCPLDSHLSGGASRQARGCSPHPWEPLAAGPRPPERLTCNRRLHFPLARPPGPRACPLIPTFPGASRQAGVLAAPLGTPCRRAEAPEGALTCNRRLHFP